MSFRKFMELCGHHLHSVVQHFHCPPKFSHTHVQSVSSTVLLLLALVKNHWSVLCLYRFAFCRTLYSWSHAIREHLCLSMPFLSFCLEITIDSQEAAKIVQRGPICPSTCVPYGAFQNQKFTLAQYVCVILSHFITCDKWQVWTCISCVHFVIVWLLHTWNHAIHDFISIIPHKNVKMGWAKHLLKSDGPCFTLLRHNDHLDIKIPFVSAPLRARLAQILSMSIQYISSSSNNNSNYL